jgi:NAD(P)-dependent dehydrogenase (short-subunit alcohol dehydrogenase family)
MVYGALMSRAIKGSVLITGASSGIGEACAVVLDRAGYKVFAGVRKAADYERLQAMDSPNLRPLMLDVTDQDQIQEAVEIVRSLTGSGGLYGLVNNAGIAIGGPMEFVPLEELRSQMEVNFIGPVAVSQAFLPLLRRAPGRIILNGSISGRFASPYIGPYSASKFALEAVADVLRIELKPWDIRVSLIEAGNIATPIWSRSLKEFDRTSRNLPPEAFDLYGGIIRIMRDSISDKKNGAPPEEFARLVLHILETPNPKARYRLGRDAKIKAFIRLLPDSVVDWFVWRKVPRDR